MCEADIAAAYWRDHAARGPALKPLGKPCHDCAVVWGLYAEFSDSLAEQPSEIVEAVCGNWFCHNHPFRACRGNIDRVASAIEARRAETAQTGSVHESAVPQGDAQTQPASDPTHD